MVRVSSKAKKPRALVTGGAGFVGSHLCERLLSEGYRVLCMDNLITGTLENVAHLEREANFEYVEHDVSTYVDVSGELDEIYLEILDVPNGNKVSKSTVYRAVKNFLENRSRRLK